MYCTIELQQPKYAADQGYDVSRFDLQRGAGLIAE